MDGLHGFDDDVIAHCGARGWNTSASNDVEVVSTLIKFGAILGQCRTSPDIRFQYSLLP